MPPLQIQFILNTGTYLTILDKWYKNCVISTIIICCQEIFHQRLNITLKVFNTATKNLKLNEIIIEAATYKRVSKWSLNQAISFFEIFLELYFPPEDDQLVIETFNAVLIDGLVCGNKYYWIIILGLNSTTCFEKSFNMNILFPLAERNDRKNSEATENIHDTE